MTEMTPLKSIMMADKKENEMQEGIPTKLRGLDVEGNSINVSMKEAKKSLFFVQSISNGSLNDINIPGEYIVYPAVKDNPFNDFCWLKIIGGSDYIQILISFIFLEEKKRSYINGKYSEWK